MNLDELIERKQYLKNTIENLTQEVKTIDAQIMAHYKENNLRSYTNEEGFGYRMDNPVSVKYDAARWYSYIKENHEDKLDDYFTLEPKFNTKAFEKDVENGKLAINNALLASSDYVSVSESQRLMPIKPKTTK